MTTKTIAVHGASGSQGAPLAGLLEAAGHTVRPVTRADGADLLDRASLEAAYAGADAVVVQLPLVYDERALSMGDNAARAAESAGVRHLVVNTGGPIPPEPIGIPFVDARHLAARAAVERVTVVQPSTYLENLSAPWSAPRVTRDGVILYPVPEQAPMSWVATEDVALAIATAVEHGVVGSFALPGAPRTGDEVAAAIGSVLGRDVRWQQIEPEAYADLLRPHVGDHAADGTGAVYRMMLESAPPPAADAAPARAALGFSPRGVEAWASEAAWTVALPA